MAYKVFNKGLINRYGKKFEEKSIYSLDTSERELKFGNNGYGYHYVDYLEDGLRYFDGMNEEIDIATVYPLGDVVESFDDYYGYYNMYVTDKIYIDHVLNRNEIIDYALDLSIPKAERFITGYKLNDYEKELFEKCYHDTHIDKAIDYYQNHNMDAYNTTKVLKKVR